MQMADLMEKLALLWPKKFDGPALSVWAEAYKAAVGHAQGERLESAWQRFMEGGINAYPPSPKDLAELLPRDRDPMAMKAGKARHAEDERRRREACDWLATWWQPLLDQAERTATPEMLRSLRFQASAACEERAFAVAMARAKGHEPSPCAPEQYANAMWLAMNAHGIRTNRVPVAELPETALEMWRALHAGQKQEAA